MHIAASQFNIGVEIFLFVSGIGLYFAYEKKPRFKDYYVKRLINVYFISIVIYLIFGGIVAILTKNSDMFYFFSRAFGLNWFLGKSNFYWYVSFIMLMYAVFPLFYKLVKIIENKKTNTLIVATIISLYFLIIIAFRNTSFFETYEIGLTRVPIFFAGSYAGCLVKNKKSFGWLFYLLAGSGILIKLVAIKFNVLIFNRISSFFFFFSVLLILLVVLNLLPSVLKTVFAWFGKMSLELYLIHGIIYTCISDYYCEYCNEITYLLTIIVAIPFSFLISKFREFVIKKYLSSKK